MSRAMFRFFRAIPQSPVPGRVHTLSDNRNLTPDEYARCVTLVERVQRLYDSADDYREQHGLDHGAVFAENEWAGMVPASGIVFRTTYNDINYLRLHAPFAGYHL